MTVVGLCLVVKQIYPDRVSVPKTYEGGLEAELGGPRAVRVSIETRHGYTHTNHSRQGHTGRSSMGSRRHSTHEVVVYIWEEISSNRKFKLFRSTKIPS